MFDLGTAFDGLGMIASAWDTYNQYSSQAEKYRSDAGVYVQDADLEKKAAQDARKRGVQDVEDILEQKDIMVGRQKAAMGASGVEVGGGTFANILSDTETKGKSEASTAWQNALREAYGHDVAAKNYKRMANSSRNAADQSDDNAVWGAVGSIASGISSFF